MPDEVQIHETESMDLRGATVIDGFPSVGLVSTIAANYLIDMLKLRPIGIMDASAFPTLSVVHGGEPLNPVRIYGGEKKGVEGRTEKVVVFISEFQPAPPMVRPIAQSIIQWAKSKQCGLVISPEGLVLEEEEGNPEGIDVFAIGSTKKARELVQKKDVKPFTHGIITGVSGILLNLGKREGVDVISILAEAHANYPDARSAATVIEVIAKLIDIKVNVEPLYKEAEGFEKQIRALRKQAAVRDKGQAPSPQMYG